MITNPTISVSCDGCDESVEFDFAHVCKYANWKGDEHFTGWLIDWEGPNGDALCPECKTKEQDQ
jgi:hypothetical protein